MVETPVETSVDKAPDNVIKKRDFKGGIILCLVGLLLLFMGVQEVRLLTSGEKVTGSIVDYQKSAQGSDDEFNTYDVKYAYYYGGKRYQGSFTQKTYNTMTINPGKQISITVLPGRPSVSKATDKLNPLFVILEFAGGLALLGFGLTRFKGQEIAI